MITAFECRPDGVYKRFKNGNWRKCRLDEQLNFDKFLNGKRSKLDGRDTIYYEWNDGDFTDGYAIVSL